MVRSRLGGIPEPVSRRCRRLRRGRPALLLGDKRPSLCETGYSARSLYAATRSNSGMISLSQAAFQSRSAPFHPRSTDNLATGLHALATRTGVIRPIESYLPAETCGTPVVRLLHHGHSGSSLGTRPAHWRLWSETADRVRPRVDSKTIGFLT